MILPFLSGVFIGVVIGFVCVCAFILAGEKNR